LQDVIAGRRKRLNPKEENTYSSPSL